MDGYYCNSLSSVTLPSPNKFPTLHSHGPRHLSQPPRMVASFSFLQGSSACPPGHCLVGTGRRGRAGSPGTVGIGWGLCHVILRRLWGVHVITVAREAGGERGREEKGMTLRMNHVSVPQPGPAMWPRASRCHPLERRASRRRGLGSGWYSPLPDVGIHRLGEDGGRGLGDSGVGLKPFYLQEEVCARGTTKQGH